MKFEPCDSIEPSKRKNKMNTYALSVKRFLKSGNRLARKKCKGSNEANKITAMLRVAIKKHGFNVKVHKRGDYIYLERIDEE